MLKNFASIVGLITVFCMVSCSEFDLFDKDNFIDGTIESFEVETRSGANGCFELVYPIDIEMPNGEIIEIGSMEEAKELLKEWKEINPDLEGKPSLIYPIELINEDGELTSINDRLELKAYVKECKMGSGGFGKRCFKVVYPITVEFPDGSSFEAEDRRDLKQALRDWKDANPDVEEKPSLAFPIEVYLLEDKETVTVNSFEEMRQLKKDCKG